MSHENPAIITNKCASTGSTVLSCLLLLSCPELIWTQVTSIAPGVIAARVSGCGRERKLQEHELTEEQGGTAANEPRRGLCTSANLMEEKDVILRCHL